VNFQPSATPHDLAPNIRSDILEMDNRFEKGLRDSHFCGRHALFILAII
jgi:hypothetical protein